MDFPKDRVFIRHPDEIPWGRRANGISGQDGNIAEGGRSKYFGEPDRGPWAFLVEVNPNVTPPVHSHDTFEFTFVVEGQMTFGDRVCTPGTMIYVEADTTYTFTAGPKGVKFMVFRPEPTTTELAEPGS